MVDSVGVEPTTLCVQSRRSPIRATSPYKKIVPKQLRLTQLRQTIWAVATRTGLEPVIFAVTGQRVYHLHQRAK